MLNSITKLTLSVLLLLQGCSSGTQYGQVSHIENLNQIMAMSNSKYKPKKLNKGPNKIREAALKDTALSLGAQAGLASRAKAIDDQLIRHSRLLDHIYDFNALVLEHNVLPPVLLEGRNTFNLADLQTIRVSNRTYRVSKQAHFITTAPNWRQYLWMDYKPPELPHVSLLPTTRVERTIWQYYANKGWEQGIEQANTILEESIARIKQDFNGMILYRKLLAMNMVSPPYVSDTDLGVTGDSEEIHIDDRVLRITALPALNMNADQWHAAVEKDEETLTKLRRLEQKVNTSKISISSNTWQPINSSVKVNDTHSAP